MPLSEMEGMAGEGFLFSIFPTETVRQNMAVGLVNASQGEVERLWTSYQKATISNGLPPYSKAGKNLPVIQFMEQETGYPRLTVVAFLNGLEKAVREQGWDWKWLDPKAAREAGEPLTAGESISKALKATGQGAADFLKPGLDPVTNLVKYAAVALVAGAVIYGIYHGSKLFKGASRRKG